MLLMPELGSGLWDAHGCEINEACAAITSICTPLSPQIPKAASITVVAPTSVQLSPIVANESLPSNTICLWEYYLQQLGDIATIKAA